MEITISLTDDWTVDSYQESDAWPAVFLTAPNGAQLRFEGDSNVLARIGKAWAAEFEVTANGRNPDATLDKIDEKIDNLEALLTEHRKGEERRYPDDFQKGDWVQFPPSKVWRQIDHVTEGTLHTQRVVQYMYGGILHGQYARAQTRYPYCPAARFDEVCDR